MIENEITETDNAENPAEVTPETPEQKPDVLADLLSGYNSPMSVIPDTDTDTPGGNQSPDMDVDNSAPTSFNKDGSPRKRRGRKPLPDMEISGNVITGKMFLFFIDSIVPFGIEFLNNKVSDVKIDGKRLKIPDEQIKELVPLADQVVKELKLSGNPVALLIGGLLTIYGINLATVRNEVKQGNG